MMASRSTKERSMHGDQDAQQQPTASEDVEAHALKARGRNDYLDRLVL